MESNKDYADKQIQTPIGQRIETETQMMITGGVPPASMAIARGNLVAASFIAEGLFRVAEAISNNGRTPPVAQPPAKPHPRRRRR